MQVNFTESLFNIVVKKSDLAKFATGEAYPDAIFSLKPELSEVYANITNTDPRVVVIIPIFTASAYSEPGFYSYYRGECDSSCLTVSIKDRRNLTDTSSVNSVKILELLGYQTITDIDVDKDPSILQNYDKLILLHNEYVTKKMFDAITAHPKVMYLYPNSLYAEIDVNYEKNEITLVRGHDYPSGVDNGFDWKFDNTRPYEFDTDCKSWDFYEIDNGIMLNCYPEKVIWKNQQLLEQIKNF